MPNARFCQTERCGNRTETDHPHCPACEQTPPPRRLHRAANAALRRRRCTTTGCEQRPTHRATKCYEHQIFWDGWEFAKPVPEPPVKGTYEWDIVCLQCADRRTACGTEDDAKWTRLRLGACARCRGPLVVERADLGGISSPSRGISVTFNSGRAAKRNGLS